MHIGRSINVALAKRGMKKTEMASALGCSNQYITKMSKSTELGLGTIKKLAEFFDMQVSEFISLGED